MNPTSPAGRRCEGPAVLSTAVPPLLALVLLAWTAIAGAHVEADYDASASGVSPRADDFVDQPPSTQLTVDALGVASRPHVQRRARIRQHAGPRDAGAPLAAWSAEGYGAGLVEVQHGFRDAASRRSGTIEDGADWFKTTSASIGSFYLYLYGIVGIAYLIVRGLEMVAKITYPRQWIIDGMRSVAGFYGKHPVVAPVLATGVLFGIGDIIAQFSQDYWADWTEPGRWSIRLTLSVMLCAALLHGLALNEAYMWVEMDMQPPRDVLTGVIKVAKFMGWSYLWLLISCIVFGTLCGTIHKSITNFAVDCGAAGIAGIPMNIKDSAIQHGGLYGRTLVSSALFWTPSHLANFWSSQRWTPTFRTTWDGCMALLWNLHVLRGCGGPMAVGPWLSGVAPSSGQVPSQVDCSRWSFMAMLNKVWEWIKAIGNWIKTGAMKIWNGICWVCQNFWNSCKWLWCRIWYWFRVIFWWLWYIILWIFTAARLAVYLVVLIVFKALSFVFGIWDTLKGWMWLGFLPDIFPYSWAPHDKIYPGEQGWPGGMAPTYPEMPDWCSTLFS